MGKQNLMDMLPNVIPLNCTIGNRQIWICCLSLKEMKYIPVPPTRIVRPSPRTSILFSHFIPGRQRIIQNEPPSKTTWSHFFMTYQVVLLPRSSTGTLCHRPPCRIKGYIATMQVFQTCDKSLCPGTGAGHG